MSGFLANIETSIADEGPDESEAEEAQDESAEAEEEDTAEDESAEDGDEPASGDEEDESEEGDSDEDAEEDEPDSEDEAHAGEDIPDATEFKVGDELITGAELKKRGLRQADYTRKTQELAEMRKNIEAETETLREENEEFTEWAKSLTDPEEMAFELQRYYPKAYQALKDKIIEDAIAEQEMDGSTREERRRRKHAEATLRAQEKDREADEKRQARKDLALKTATLRANFDKWSDETLKEAGLDPEEHEHQRLLRERITVRHRGETWTRETFQKAAQAIAKLMGKEPPKPKAAKKGAKPTAAPAKPASGKRLPPSPRPTGHKAPAGAEERRAKPKKPKDTAEGFAALRAEYGVR